MSVLKEDPSEHGLVMMPEDYLETAGNADYIDSVDEIIKFYEFIVQNCHEIDKKMSPEPKNLVSLPPVSITTRIITELESGTFEPVKYMSDDALKFENWERWALSIYEAPATRKGHIELGPLVKSIKHLKTEIAEIKRKKTIAAMNQYLEKTDSFFDEHPLLKFHPAYGLHMLAVVTTPIFKGVWKAGNFSMFGLRSVSNLVNFQGEKAGLIVENSKFENERNEAEEDLNKQ